MSNYKESQIAGTRWTRSHKIVFDNQYKMPPKVTFYEQDIVSVEGVDSIINTNQYIEKSYDANATIALCDPVTGALTGNTLSQQELQIILYSLYTQVALERDGE